MLDRSTPRQLQQLRLWRRRQHIRFGGSGGSGPTNNYTANDLVTILKTAETARGLTGTIRTNSELKATEAAGGNKSFTQEFTADGGTFTPAACGNLLNNLVAAGEKVLNRNDWRGASLDATNDIISVAATSDTVGAATVLATTKNIMGRLASQCGTMTIKNSSISIGFTISPLSVSSNADQTYGYEEDIIVSGKTTKTATIEAVYGNLYIGDVSLTDPNLSNMEANVNAIIAAAK